MNTDQLQVREPGEFSHRGDHHNFHKKFNNRLLLISIMIVIVLCDVLSKIFVVHTLEGHEPIHLGFIDFIVLRNPGAAFSMATGSTWILTIIALALVAIILRVGRKLGSVLWAIAFGLVLGGALGNLGDRFFRSPGPFLGHVVDFISIGWWPVFNIADSAICCGVALIFIQVLRGIKPDGTHEESSLTKKL